VAGEVKFEAGKSVVRNTPWDSECSGLLKDKSAKQVSRGVGKKEPKNRNA